jgi:hypothetical protein
MAGLLSQDVLPYVSTFTEEMIGFHFIHASDVVLDPIAVLALEPVASGKLITEEEQFVVMMIFDIVRVPFGGRDDNGPN